jgi:putative ABC transport system permease protein
MFKFALREITRNKLRFAVAIVGIIFSLTLTLILIGVRTGFTRLTSIFVEKSDADLWIASKGAKDFTSSEFIDKRILYDVRGTCGIQWAQPVLIAWGFIKKPDGSSHFVQVIGHDPRYNLCRPWKMLKGRCDDINLLGNVILDKSSKIYLGREFEIGDIVEISYNKAKVVGICEEAKTFSTYPYIFASLKSARKFYDLDGSQVSYIGAKVIPSADIKQVKETLKNKLKNYSVYERGEFINIIRNKWLTQTGMGLVISLNALLAFIVGIVVVGQTMYTATLERLREYAILKALGATNRELYQIILMQATIYAIIGYAFVCVCAFVLSEVYKTLGAPILIPWWLWAGMFFAALFMCYVASILSIFRVVKVDPMVVFRE